MALNVTRTSIDPFVTSLLQQTEITYLALICVQYQTKVHARHVVRCAKINLILTIGEEGMTCLRSSGTPDRWEIFVIIAITLKCLVSAREGSCFMQLNRNQADILETQKQYPCVVIIGNIRLLLNSAEVTENNQLERGNLLQTFCRLRNRVSRPVSVFSLGNRKFRYTEGVVFFCRVRNFVAACELFISSFSYDAKVYWRSDAHVSRCGTHKV